MCVKLVKFPVCVVQGVIAMLNDLMVEMAATQTSESNFLAKTSQ